MVDDQTGQKAFFQETKIDKAPQTRGFLLVRKKQHRNMFLFRLCLYMYSFDS